MIFSYEQEEKIRLLDKIFANIDVNVLREFAEKDEIINTLKGAGNNHCSLLSTLINDVENIKKDISTIVKCMNMDGIPSHQLQKLQTDIRGMKNRAGVY